jgi:lipoyl(octanoyl) transferase
MFERNLPLLHHPMPSRRWRTLLTPADSGVANMALDEALMERSAATGEWICRVYGWAEPTISFGRNQSALRDYDRERVERRLYAVRRPTGGRAILHYREVTYCVTAPTRQAGGLQESYVLINRLLVDALRLIGIEAALATSRVEPMQPGPIPCFDHPSSGELVASGRKLVGSAQWRSEHALLQHGSILIEDQQASVNDYLKHPQPAPPPAATLKELLGSAPSLPDVASAIFSAVALDDPTLCPLELDQPLLDAQTRLARHFADPGWTWRR